MGKDNQWRIERVTRVDRKLVLRCQGDLRQIDAESAKGKTLLHEMTFNLDERRDAEQLAEIGTLRARDNGSPDGERSRTMDRDGVRCKLAQTPDDT